MAQLYLGSNYYIDYTISQNVMSLETTVTFGALYVFTGNPDNSDSWNLLNGIITVNGEQHTLTASSGVTQAWQVMNYNGYNSFVIKHDASGNPVSNISISVSANIHFSNWATPSAASNYSGSGTLYIPAFLPKTLTITNQAGATAIVTLNGVQIKSGTTIFYGQWIGIYFNASDGYELTTHTVNGVTVQSGTGYQVTSDVTVVAGGTALSNVFINGERYIPYIDNGKSWDRYRAYIDNGTSWGAY